MIAPPENLIETPEKGGRGRMDALSDVLRVTQLTGGVFLHAEFTAPWCIEDRLEAALCGPAIGEASHLIHYHFVVEGRMVVEVPGVPAFELGAGEVVLLPRNHRHKLCSDLGVPPVGGDAVICPPINDGLFTIAHGGGGAMTRLVCGFLGCNGAETNPLIATLPPALCLNVGTSGAAEWIRSTFQHAADEIAAGRPGSSTVLAKLSELLFLEAVRNYAGALPEGQTGWLAGLRDPHVAKALAALHRDIARAWTVEDLGREVGLSRSALNDRFTRLIGMPPIQYLGAWRMQVATEKLRRSSDSVARIAFAVGYDSEAAFSRAFKSALGAPPAAWRRAQSGAPVAVAP
jgi:AraC-like DNA-binding protein